MLLDIKRKGKNKNTIKGMSNENTYSIETDMEFGQYT